MATDRADLIRRMESMLADEQLTDVTFAVGENNEEIRANTYILAAASPVFRSMFFGDFGRPPVVGVPDGTPDAFRELLRYVYTGKATFTSDNVMPIVNLSKKYLLTKLYARAIAYVKRQIDATNVFEYIALAEILEELQEKCYEVIDQDAEKVFKTEEFLHIDDRLLTQILARDSLAVNETVVFERTVARVKAQLQSENKAVPPEAIREALGDTLFLIRFPVMSMKEFADNVDQSQILTEEERFSIYRWFANRTPPGRFISRIRRTMHLEHCRSCGDRQNRHKRAKQDDGSVREPVLIRPSDWELLQKHLTLEYDVVNDRYTRGELTYEGYETFAFASRNMYRKEEYDWNMAYLSRNPYTDWSEAEISWRVEVPEDCVGRVARVYVRLGKLDVFKSGKIVATICCGTTCTAISNDSGVYVIENPGIHMPYVKVSVHFSGGEGDVAWQHAQLFRTEMAYPRNNMKLRVDFF